MPLSHIHEVIQDILKRVSHKTESTSRNTWEIPYLDTQIQVAYHQRSGQIYVESNIGKIITAESNQGALHYLLQKNYILQNCTISIRDREIWLHAIIDERNISLPDSYKLIEAFYKQTSTLRSVLQEQFQVTMG